MPRVPQNPNNYTINFLSNQKAQTSAQAQQVGPGIQAVNIPAVSWPTPAYAAGQISANWQVPYTATTTGGGIVADSSGYYVTVVDSSIFSIGDFICIENSAGTITQPFTQRMFTWVTKINSSHVFITYLGYYGNLLGIGGMEGSTVGVLPSVTTKITSGQSVTGQRLDALVHASISSSVVYPTTHINVASFVLALRTNTTTVITSFMGNVLELSPTTLNVIGTQLAPVFSGANGLPSGTGWTNSPIMSHSGAAVLTLAPASSNWSSVTTEATSSGIVHISEIIGQLPPINPATGGYLVDFTIGSKGTSPVESGRGSIYPAGHNGDSATALFADLTYTHPAGTPVYQTTTTGTETWSFCPVYWVSNPSENTTFQQGQLIIDAR